MVGSMTNDTDEVRSVRQIILIFYFDTSQVITVKVELRRWRPQRDTDILGSSPLFYYNKLAR